jgi:hypothetical protein
MNCGKLVKNLEPLDSEGMRYIYPGNSIADNPNTTQTLEYTKDKYNAKIIKQRVSPKVPPTTYKGQRIK